MAVVPKETRVRPTWPALHLFLSFAFAFLTNEAIHEMGHYVADRAAGVRDVGLILDPFGGSHIVLGAPLPAGSLGLAAAAGPLLNLIVGLAALLLLWRRRSPALLPLLLMGPVAMIQESVTLSLGLLTPGGDAELIVRNGLPAAVMIIAAISLLAGGLVLVARLLPIIGLHPEDSFAARFGVVVGGMTSLMLVRFVASFWRAPEALVENGVPLVFSLLLALLVAGIFPQAARHFAEPGSLPRVTWSGLVSAAVLAAGMFIFQLMFLN